MITYSKLKGLKTFMSVNPNLLSKEMSEKIIKSGLDHIIISLDSTNDRVYKKIRGENANYGEAVKNINNLLFAKYLKIFLPLTFFVVEDIKAYIRRFLAKNILIL
jgi:MoaA/NifB/PqqE/SkfB family radical SAM enzyme